MHCPFFYDRKHNTCTTMNDDKFPLLELLEVPLALVSVVIRMSFMMRCDVAPEIGLVFWVI